MPYSQERLLSAHLSWGRIALAAKPDTGCAEIRGRMFASVNTNPFPSG